MFVAIINDFSVEQDERQGQDFRRRSRRASEARAETRAAPGLESNQERPAELRESTAFTGILESLSRVTLQEGRQTTTASIDQAAAKAEVSQVRTGELTQDSIT